MREAKNAALGRHAPALRPEFVPLGFIVERPSYGYEVYKRFTDSLSGLWGISESQMYATLKRLEERGLVVHLGDGAFGDDDDIESPGGRKPRRGPGAEKRLLAPSDAGRAAFDAWLADPTPTSPRVLRLEFVTRLFFASRRDPSAGAALFASQRAAVVDAIGRLRDDLAGPRGGSAGDGGSAAGFDPLWLALSFSEGQLVAVLEWMDARVAPALS